MTTDTKHTHTDSLSDDGVRSRTRLLGRSGGTRRRERFPVAACAVRASIGSCSQVINCTNSCRQVEFTWYMDEISLLRAPDKMDRRVPKHGHLLHGMTHRRHAWAATATTEMKIRAPYQCCARSACLAFVFW